MVAKSPRLLVAVFMVLCSKLLLYSVNS